MAATASAQTSMRAPSPWRKRAAQSWSRAGLIPSSRAAPAARVLLMSEQEAIAARLERPNAAVIELVHTAPPTAWRHPVGEGDRRTVATLAHHIGAGYDNGVEWGLSIRSSRRMTEITPESI